MIKPDTFKCVRDKGMPVHGRMHQYGNLYIRFRVKFPERLDAATIAAVSAALPMPPAEGGFHPTMDLDDAEEVSMGAQHIFCFVVLAIHPDSVLPAPAVSWWCKPYATG